MGNEERIKVWDIGVRGFHWSLVVLFVVAYVSGEDDSLVHAWSGYAIIGLLAFRIVWGFIGPRHARFADFVHGRAAVLEYARALARLRPVHYLGHNPLGGWMVVALLVLLIGVSWSGLEVYGAQGHGPLAGNGVTLVSPALADGDRRGDGKESAAEEFWEEIHEALANLTLFLVLVHIAGVIVTSVIYRENLIRSMINGYKKKRP